MSVPLTLLGLLERGPSHGYDLKRDYNTYFGRGRPLLRYSQVYATLSRLARDGKAVAGPAEQGGGPERRRYVITEVGIADVERWLAEPAPPEPDLQSELFAKVVLALMLGRRPTATWTPSGRRTCSGCAAHRTQAARRSPRRAARRPHALPPGGSTCDGSTTPRPGWTCLASGPPVTADPGTAKIIEARDLFLSFGETPALRGASLAVRRGEIVAVMGPSGSGKSTLLHCLAGILVPEQGEVWFDGQRLDALSDDRRSTLRRDRFGFVFQSGQLVPELTAEQNVALPLLLSGARRGPAMTAARRWFGTLGLDGLEHRRSGELSGGQAQRVALARGLVAGPEVLFADEPTGSPGLGVRRAGDGPAHRRRP